MSNKCLYINKAVFLNDLRYIRDQQIVLDSESEQGKQMIKDLNWFIRMVEDYPNYGHKLNKSGN